MCSASSRNTIFVFLGLSLIRCNLYFETFGAVISYRYVSVEKKRLGVWPWQGQAPSSNDDPPNISNIIESVYPRCWLIIKILKVCWKISEWKFILMKAWRNFNHDSIKSRSCFMKKKITKKQILYHEKPRWTFEELIMQLHVRKNECSIPVSMWPDYKFGRSAGFDAGP